MRLYKKNAKAFLKGDIMAIRLFLFTLLPAFTNLENANAYLKETTNDASQQEILEFASEMFDLEQIAEREHPQQWRGRRPGRRGPHWRGPRGPYWSWRRPRLPRGLWYPYIPPVVIVPIYIPNYNRSFLPYCSYVHYDYIDLPRRLRRGLLTAICDGEKEIVREIIVDDGVSPHRSWVTDETPLMVAAQIGNEDIVEMLIDEFDVNWRARDQWGHTAAMWAYESGHRGLGDELCSLHSERSNERRCRREYHRH